MNRILRDTHKKQNIDLLRVRDYFFNKARKLNTLKLVCQIIPVAILFVSYMPYISEITFVNDFRDYYSGFFAIVSFALVLLINNKIESHLKISNAFREEYDVNVFGVKRNDYLYSKDIINKYIGIAEKAVNDSGKYEYWYEEIFSENHPNNVICCQMDNIIYTYHVYEKTRVIYSHIFAGLLLAVLGIWIYVRNLNFVILSFLALFSIFQVFIEYIDVSRDLVEQNRNINDMVLEGDKTDYSMEEIRCIQDCIVSNRDKSLFIPKFIRDKYLEDGNPYYRDLDRIKDKLLKQHSISVPSSADEIDVLSSDGERSVSLSVIQNRLRAMLSEMKAVLEKNNIQYTLDGGTLIGAKREGGRFIFWDDDIDIAIRYEDFSRAKDCLINELSDKYEFQDYYNEEFYSPRLSSLRMREKNSKSVIDERDSALFELYEKRGLFIDIYVYAPILCNRTIDRIYRRFRIHSIHKSIKKTESMWRSDRKKYEKEFRSKKDRYMKRVEWYLLHAKCKEYYAYTPNYIENLKEPGPYIKMEDLYGSGQLCEFEGMQYPVPTNSEEVLKAYYGDSWNECPFKPIEAYEKYSDKKFCITKLKHLVYADVKNG